MQEYINKNRINNLYKSFRKQQISITEKFIQINYQNLKFKIPLSLNHLKQAQLKISFEQFKKQVNKQVQKYPENDKRYKENQKIFQILYELINSNYQKWQYLFSFLEQYQHEDLIIKNINILNSKILDKILSLTFYQLMLINLTQTNITNIQNFQHILCPYLSNINLSKNPLTKFQSFNKTKFHYLHRLILQETLIQQIDLKKLFIRSKKYTNHQYNIIKMKQIYSQQILRQLNQMSPQIFNESDDESENTHIQYVKISVKKSPCMILKPNITFLLKLQNIKNVHYDIKDSYYDFIWNLKLYTKEGWNYPKRYEKAIKKKFNYAF